MKRILPPTYFFGAIALMAGFHFLFPLWTLVRFPWRLLGVVPLVAGVLLNLLADQAFKRHNIAVKPFEESNVLLTHGVFRLSRNPMYLGMTLLLAGIAILMGSITPWLVVFLLATLFDRLFITPEERMLEEAFGGQFREYRRHVRRWI